MTANELYQTSYRLVPVGQGMTLAQLCGSDRIEDRLAEGRLYDGHPAWGYGWLETQPVVLDYFTVSEGGSIGTT